MRQNITISLGPEPDFLRRGDELDRLAGLHGGNRSKLIQMIADGELLIVPKHDTREILGGLAELVDRLEQMREEVLQTIDRLSTPS